MADRRIIYRVHAVQRMFERGIDTADIRRLLEVGEVIETYPNDKPFPSRLLLGRGQRPTAPCCRGGPSYGR